MKSRTMILSTALPVLLLFMFSACAEQEPEGFTQQKLDLRQKIDETILDIDQELEELHKSIALAETTGDTTRIKAVENNINKLKAAREKLLTRLSALEEVAQQDWLAFEQETKQVLTEAERKLMAAEVKPEQPEPTPLPY